MNVSNIHIATLVAGVLFMTLGGMFLLDAAAVWSVPPLIVGPMVLIGLGLAIIAGSLSKRMT